VAKSIKKVLEAEIPALTLGASSLIDAKISQGIVEKITTSVNAKAADYGIKLLSVELRKLNLSAIDFYTWS
jgi:regulator of protease activity HflC (stomatin/prohibitin superfamily)